MAHRQAGAEAMNHIHVWLLGEKESVEFVKSQ